MRRVRENDALRSEVSVSALGCAGVCRVGVCGCVSALGCAGVCRAGVCGGRRGSSTTFAESVARKITLLLYRSRIAFAHRKYSLAGLHLALPVSKHASPCPTRRGRVRVASDFPAGKHWFNKLRRTCTESLVSFFFF